MKLIGNKKAIRSPEFHVKKERERRIRLGVYSVLVVLIILAPFIILRAQRFLISSVSIIGNEVTKDDELESIISKDLAGNYYLIIPRSNILFYPKSKIKQDIMQAIPRIDTVHISFANFHSIKVAVTERMPEALYCKYVSNVLTPAGCYFLDKNGFIFSGAPEFSGGVYVAYTNLPVIEAPLGQHFLDPETFAKLESMLHDLSLLRLIPKILVVKGDEYDLSLPSNTVVMWKSTDDTQKIESNLVSFLNDMSIFKDGRTMSELQYIDLRFGNKVFYKFKGE